MPATPAMPAVPRDSLVAWLDDYLKVRDLPDKSLNGLQVEGRDEVTRVAVAVDGTLAAIEAAVESGADFLIVHHGLFWGEPLAVTGAHRRRVKALLDAGLSLYAAHAPLDAHEEIGNSRRLAVALGLGDLRPFATRHGVTWGVKGAFAAPVGVQELADSVQTITGEVCLVHAGGPVLLERVGIVSGAGADFIVEAAREGLDGFISGEPSHAHFAEPFENGVTTIWAGHYETETFGVRALAVKLEDEFGLPWQFLHLPTGL